MNWAAVTFDWNQARAFLATVEEGSLSAAARVLKQTQPTLSRQVAALEQDLGVTLFERVGRSLVPTASGLELLDHVRGMGEAATRVSLSASGQSQAIEGRVTITASDGLSAFQLPPILKRLRAEAPGITVEVVVSNEIRDLRLREADIAIRHVQPDHPDLIAKRLRDSIGHLYAMPAYLDRAGRPATLADLSDHDVIGHGDNARMAEFLADFGVTLTDRNFTLSADNGLVVLELVKQGLGISALSREMAATVPALEPVLPDQLAIPIPVWLVTHRELHTSRRIRIVFDLLAAMLGPQTSPITQS
ncbi:LysR family transcriptional regulator [Hwanghaeella grinnelliae]|uniref:LysR family transcriptional regulator n=1 Tax=Hwanghaeella grinnelliae TaxID=2500179 RepID=A0A3S2WAJ4_9PROT|nr:LysR family transcriptional regulator [Hwanghaeella grinnelliae]RVU37964.1 LysR family transcriptional regulator [Hwanghaeella grinnelliae]